jgi:DNA-binding transcriptional ArsR family regulator
MIESIASVDGSGIAVIVVVFPYFSKYITTAHEFAPGALLSSARTPRLAVFRLRLQAGSAELSVGGLRDRISILAATLSAHLNQLRSAGLVNEVRERRVIRFPRRSCADGCVVGLSQ